MFQSNNIFPALALPLAGKAMTVKPTVRRRRSTLSRRELRRLIADMID